MRVAANTIELASLCKKKIPYKLLDDFFYEGMRNELSLQSLLRLKKQAAELPGLDMYGVYCDEKHFLDAYKFFLSTTAETRHRGLFFLRNVLPKLSHYDNMLDVGAANGLMTKWIGSRFKKVTAIDSNFEAISCLAASKRIVRKKTEMELIHASILDVDLKQDYYNLGLLSHVLYYINDSLWVDVAKRVYDAIAPGGLLVIVLNGDELGKLSLLKHFNSRAIDIESFVVRCVNEFQSSHIEVFKSVEVARALDLNSMLQIAGFFLYDAGGLATKRSLMDYVDIHCKKNNGMYEMNFSQKFILINKPIGSYEKVTKFPRNNIAKNRKQGRGV